MWYNSKWYRNKNKVKIKQNKKDTHFKMTYRCNKILQKVKQGNSFLGLGCEGILSGKNYYCQDFKIIQNTHI